MLTEAIAGSQFLVTGAIAIARAIHHFAVVVSPLAAVVAPHFFTRQTVLFGQLILQHSINLTFYKQYSTKGLECQALS